MKELNNIDEQKSLYWKTIRDINWEITEFPRRCKNPFKQREHKQKIANTSLCSYAYRDYGLRIDLNGSYNYGITLKGNCVGYGEHNIRLIENKYGFDSGYISKTYLPSLGIIGDTFCNEFVSEEFSIAFKALNAIKDLLDSKLN